MRRRLIVGLSLAGGLLTLLVLDAWLARVQPPDWPVPGTTMNLGHWVTNGLLSTTLVLALTVLAVHELVHLARGRGYRPFGRTARVFAAALVLGPYVSYNLSPLAGAYDESLGMLCLAVAVGFCFLLQTILYRTENAIEHMSITLFIMYYAGGLAGFMIKLRMEVGGGLGIVLLIFSVFLVKMTDTGAYFTGRALGRTQMVPWLSPKKTWEGFAGGMVTTVLCAVGVGYALKSFGWIEFANPHVSFLGAMVLLGVLLGVFSAAGDLAASVLKRDAAVKDSGQSLPGLGGVLDVLDSPLLAAPVAWLFWTRLFPVIPPV